jgi:uncharacterized protein (TIGR03067 family)
MMLKQGTALALLCSLLMLILSDQDDKELKRLQGTWILAKLEHDPGLAKSTAKTFEIKIAGSAYVATVNNSAVEKGLLEIDSGKNPAHLTFSVSEGDNRDKDFQCIYKFNKELLVICTFHDPNKGRPKAFDASKGTSQVILYFERSKERKPEEKKIGK